MVLAFCVLDRHFPTTNNMLESKGKVDLQKDFTKPSRYFVSHLLKICA
jgi:hypothetical protein